MSEAKVAVFIDAAGLEEEMAKLHQFGQLGEEAIRSAGALSPEHYDRMGQGAGQHQTDRSRYHQVGRRS